MATSFQLTPDAEERLDFLVSETGRSKDYYLCEIIERALEDVEDYYLAADVLKRVRSGKEKVHTVSEVKEYLALED